MFDFTVDGKLDDLCQGEYAVWSHEPLEPLTPGPLTPFSHSVVVEIVQKAWFRHYQQLGFEPSRARVVRKDAGRPYLDIARSARLEAQHAGLEPLTMRVNGASLPLCAWEKPGFVSGMRTGRGRKRIESQMDALLTDIDAIIARTRTWYVKTAELNWTQAELLQVMEEIERVSLDAMSAYLVVRLQLQLVYYRLIWLLLEGTSFPQCLNLINGSVCDLEGLIESQMADDLVGIAEAIGDDTPSLTWLRTGDCTDWRARVDDLPVAGALAEFIEIYGHRAAGEGETANPRWSEDPSPLCRELLVMIERATRPPERLPSNGSMRRLQEATGKRAKEATTLVNTLRQGLQLQSKATDAVAYLLAGTRNWAVAAGKEAMSDGRLLTAEDAFFFELEELKQMMTGEWNVSARDEIQAQATRRRAEHETLLQAMPAPMFIGDAAAVCAHSGLPGAIGHTVGPLRRWKGFDPQAGNGAVVGAEQMDSGWSIVLPTAQGVVIACGTPYDPIVAASRHWHTPMMVGLSHSYADLVEGAQTTVDVERALIDQ